MDPGYTIRHRPTRRGLRVVVDLTATGSATTLARAVDAAVSELRELLRPPGRDASLRPFRGPRPDES